MNSPLKMSMIITGDASGLKSAAASAKGDVADLTNSASKSAEASKAMASGNDQAVAALNREAEALRKATDAAKKLADARQSIGKLEYETREAAEARLGLKPRQPASDQSATPSAEVVGTLSKKATSEETSAKSNVWGQLLGRSSPSDKSLKAQTSELAGYTSELNRARERYKPLMEAQQRHLTLLREIAIAQKMGLISEEQRVSIAQKAEAAHSAELSAIQNGGLAAQKSAALARHEVTNLTYQLNDIVVMLASGQSPFLMMMQQGGQVAQIMGNRGLGAILPAIGTGLLQLISPTTLLLAGITAVGYAGAWAYGKLFDEVRKVDDITTEHEANVRKLNDAYKYAGSGADEYYRRTVSGGRLAAAGSRKELEGALNLNARTMLKDLVFTDTQVGGAGNYWAVDTEYAEFSDAITYLRETVNEGKPDILGFREMVEQRWNLEPNNDSLLKKGLAILKLAKDATTAAETLELTSAKTIRANNAIAAEQRRGEAYNDALNQLRGIGASELSELAKVRQNYAAGMGNANGKDAREDVARQREEALKRLTLQEQRQLELARLDIQLQTARDPLTRAELAAQRERIQLSGMETVGQEAEIRIRQARNLVMAEALAMSSGQVIDLQSEVAARKQVNDAIAAGTIHAEDAALYLQLESELRPLIAAATRAEGEEKQLLLEKIAQLTAGYQALAQEQKRSDALSFIQTQKEKIASLQVELAIAGETESVRNRVMAQLDAEMEIRRRGLATGSKEAEQIRTNASEHEKLVQQLERQAEAWRTVRQAGEKSIDGLVDKISSADFEGAVQEFGKDISKSLLTLGVSNPIKNGLFGTDYGTINDVGGLSGIVSRLFGNNDLDASGIIQSALGAQTVSSMSVMAASVTINGDLGSNITKFLSSANDNSDKLAGLAGGGSALSFVGNYKNGVDPRLTDILNTAAQNFPGFKVDAISGFRPGDPRFHGKGLATDVQLTDLLTGKKLGNYQDASSFRTYEQFAQQARAIQLSKYPELTDQFRWGGYFGGSKGKYGALDTMHFDLAGKGMAGGSWGGGLNASQMALWPGVTSRGMGTAAEALNKLAGTTVDATKNLGQFGGGLESLARSFAGGGGGILSGIAGSAFPNLGGFASGQLSNAIASGSFGLWDTGGWTGDVGRKDIAGFVHGQEFVVNAAAVAQPGVRPLLEAINKGGKGYEIGGFVQSAAGGRTYSNAFSGYASPSEMKSQINIYNTTNSNVRTEEESDGRGGRRTNIFLEEAMADGLSRPGSAARRSMASNYGLQNRMVKR